MKINVKTVCLVIIAWMTFVQADIIANLVEDPGFENLSAGEPTLGGVPWSDNISAADTHIEVRTGTAHSGTNSVVFAHYARTGYLSQKLGIQVEAYTSYELSIWMMLDEQSSDPTQTNSTTINMALAASDTESGTYGWAGVGQKGTAPTVPGEWQQFIFEIDSSMLTNQVGRWLEVRFVKENPAPTEYRIFLDDTSFGIKTSQPPTNRLISIFDDFDYGSANTSDIPNWYGTSGEFYNREGDSNSPFDFQTGEVGFQWGAGTNLYLYRPIGAYSGEQYMTYSLNISTWNGATTDQAGELLVRIFKNNVFTPSSGVDVASDADSLFVAGDTRSYVSPVSNRIVNLTGTLDLTGVSLSNGDRLYFEITYTNPDSRSMCMDDVVLSLPVVQEIGDLSWEMQSGNQIRLSWQGASGATYVLQSDDDLISEPGWSNIITGISGAGGAMSVTTETSRAVSFYRLIVE